MLRRMEAEGSGGTEEEEDDGPGPYTLGEDSDEVGGPGTVSVILLVTIVV